jgi:hypothetical protein
VLGWSRSAVGGDAGGHAVLHQMLVEAALQRLARDDDRGGLIHALGHGISAQHDALMAGQVEFVKTGRLLVRQVAGGTGGGVGGEGVIGLE